MSIGRKAEPTIPISAVEAIIHATIEAMRAGGEIGIDMMYPLRHAEAEEADELMGAIAEDGPFITTGGAPPVWEEDEDSDEAAEQRPADTD